MDSPLWKYLLLGYPLTVLIEAPILFFALSSRHSWQRKLGAGLWLTACTYPIVILVLPACFTNRITYLAVAETFAPGAECLLFWLAFGRHMHGMRWQHVRDYSAIIIANLASFAVGEVIGRMGWW
jgi:hypothetical protein